MSDEPTRSSALSPNDTAMYPELAAYPMVLTVQEVAGLLRVSADLIRDRCIAGTIQHLTLGNRRRIPRHEVLRLLREL